MQQNQKNLAWLNATQFFGVLNDNLLALLIIYHLIGVYGQENAAMVVALVGGAFVLPFLIFSAPAGCLADRFPKSSVIWAVKLFEIAVTLLAVAAFVAGFDAVLYSVVFLLSARNAFLAPSKYGVIPEFAEPGGLTRANGLIESVTFQAIIIGTVLAQLLADSSSGMAALVCVAFAVTGLYSSRQLSRTPAVDGARPIALLPTKILATLMSIRSDRYLLLAIVGQAWFMFICFFAQLNLFRYGMETLGLSGAHSAYLFLTAALGIGLGLLLATTLSGRDVEFGIVPIGALGLTTTLFMLHAVPENLPTCLAFILFFGLSAGVFGLPLQTFIQFRAEPARRGEVLAASSFVGGLGVLLAALMTWFLGGPLQLTAAQGFSLVGGAMMILTLITLWTLPDFLLRFIALVTIRIFYRIRIIGREHLPIDGPALLIPNHVAWVDALLLTATNQRRIRFVVDRKIYNATFVNFLFRLMGVIPVSSDDGRSGMLEFIKRARAALDDGYMVCIFAEGTLSRNGMLMEFRGGFERIVKNSDYPIIPVYIGGAWGSILSYAHGHLLSRPPALAPYKVNIHFGKPMAATSSAMDVRQAVMELSCDYFDERKPRRKPLWRYFAESARENWSRRAVADTSGKALRYGQLLTGAIALAGKLEREAAIGKAQENHVGLLLPPSVGGAMANLALSLLGKTPVNLNYSLSEASLASIINQCSMTSIITSRAFLEKLPALSSLDGLVFLEDILSTISATDKLIALLRARLMPLAMLAAVGDVPGDGVATVIFSSGSTGEPKGVMLSHHNIMSNIEALRMVFRVDLNDNVCSALPFFHSLGFTATLWFPLVSGFSVVYHNNPMDGEKIAQMARENKSTLLLATPTFLLAYLRRAKKEDFATLRLVITGAEKLKAKVADSFQEKFGVRPMEGYGATELSPVITLSLPDVEIDGVAQHGSKDGSVGHPIPGVAIRVVDPDSGELLKPGQPGLLLVRGPNVMYGYLGRADKTAEVIKDGWYVTGDIGVMDEDGFLRITDRLSRFSKIGGEMVPHGVVEDELHSRLGQTGVLAVTSVPDDKRGERLMVVFAREATDAEALHRLMSESVLPNLWKPGRDCYIAVDALPILGTGKLDLKGLKDIALATV